MKQQKMNEQRCDSLNASNKHLSAETAKLRAEIQQLQRSNDQRQKTIEELEKQLAMSGDSVNLMQQMQKEI